MKKIRDWRRNVPLGVLRSVEIPLMAKKRWNKLPKGWQNYFLKKAGLLEDD